MVGRQSRVLLVLAVAAFVSCAHEPRFDIEQALEDGEQACEDYNYTAACQHFERVLEERCEEPLQTRRAVLGLAESYPSLRKTGKLVVLATCEEAGSLEATDCLRIASELESWSYCYSALLFTEVGLRKRGTDEATESALRQLIVRLEPHRGRGFDTPMLAPLGGYNDHVNLPSKCFK